VRADALKMPDGTPLKNIEKHRDQDVLCGRGGGTNHHVGNAHWRKLVNTNKRLYLSLPKKQKALVAKSIVHAVRAQNPPGRFLARDPSNSLWCDIGDQKATEKTSQALREGAPDIRTEMAKEGQMEKGHIRGGQLLQNGLIGLEQSKPGERKNGAAPSAPAGMPTTNPVVSSSQGGLPLPDGQGGSASMMMAFHQYLGGKNPNPSPATQAAATVSANSMPAKAPSSQNPSLHEQLPQQLPPQQQLSQQLPSQLQPQQFGSLASRQDPRQLLQRDMIYPQTVMSRKLSGHSTNGSVLDTRFMKTNPQHHNLGNGTMMSYNELAQKAADSARAGLQMTNQAAPAMRHQPGQIIPSLNNDVGWSRQTGVPLDRPQLMTELLRSSSLSSQAAALGRPNNYPGNNNFTNSMLGNPASMGSGSNFISQADSNMIARLLEQQKALMNNPLRGNTMTRLDPTNLYSMSSLGRLSHPALRNESSFGGQLPQPGPSIDSGQYNISNGGITGLTALHPSVSAVMAQMKFEQLMKKNRAEAPHLNPVAAQQLNSSRDDAEISIPAPSVPKRGVSASLDDLCRAAALNEMQAISTHPDLAKESYDKDDDEDDKVRDFCNRVKAKKRPLKKGKDNTKSAMPKLGVNDSSLVDDDSDDGVIKFLTNKRKRTAETNVSVEDHSKHSKLKTKGVEDSELDRFAHKSEGLRDADLLSRGVSLNRNFSQKIKSLPLSEASLDRGHSLAMSEISLDRGQSLGGIGFMGGDDGQFDDASEDDDPKTKKVARGYTLGTINTFPLDM